VRSFHRNALAAGSARAAAPPAKFVKVAVYGAPYLRKVNLHDYAGYDHLIRALQDKFCSHFTISEC
jgi:auxin-responsive protein IAA